MIRKVKVKKNLCQLEASWKNVVTHNVLSALSLVRFNAGLISWFDLTNEFLESKNYKSEATLCDF